MTILLNRTPVFECHLARFVGNNKGKAIRRHVSKILKDVLKNIHRHTKIYIIYRPFIGFNNRLTHKGRFTPWTMNFSNGHSKLVIGC